MVVLVLLPLCWCCLYGCLLHEYTHALTSIRVRVLTKFTKFSFCLSRCVCLCAFFISTCRNAHLQKNPNSRTPMSAFEFFYFQLVLSFTSVSVCVGVFVAVLVIIMKCAFFVNDESLFFSSVLFVSLRIVKSNFWCDRIVWCVQFFFCRNFCPCVFWSMRFHYNFIQFHNRCTTFSISDKKRTERIRCVAR